MLRDKNLVPLSRQHQHALALCVRIDRASPIPETSLNAWQRAITEHFQNEIEVHFAAEEVVVLPAATRFPELKDLVDELLADHDILRESSRAAASNTMSPEDVTTFAQRLSAHIRKEERTLFERMQELMQPEELVSMGVQLEEALKAAADRCLLPQAATRLRPKPD